MFSSQLSSVARFCPTLCYPTACSTPGFPVHHQLPELVQTPVHWVADAIQPSHPLLSPSPPAFNLSHHQVLFKWVSSSHQLAKVLEFQLQHQSFQWIFRIDLTSLVAQTVKHLSTMWETRVRSLAWEDPLEKEMAIHSRTIAWKNPWKEEPGRLHSMGVQTVGHDWVTSLPLGWTDWISLQSKGLSRVFSNTTVQKHQFFSAQLSLWSNSHIHTWLLEKP